MEIAAGHTFTEEELSRYYKQILSATLNGVQSLARWLLALGPATSDDLARMEAVTILELSKSSNHLTPQLAFECMILWNRVKNEKNLSQLALPSKESMF